MGKSQSSDASRQITKSPPCTPFQTLNAQLNKKKFFYFSSHCNTKCFNCVLYESLVCLFWQLSVWISNFHHKNDSQAEEEENSTHAACIHCPRKHNTWLFTYHNPYYRSKGNRYIWEIHMKWENFRSFRVGQDGPISCKYDTVLHLTLLSVRPAMWVGCKLFGNAVTTTEISIK
jgi:hypothetical protein